MSLLASNVRAATAFTRITETLLREVSAFGVMAAGQGIQLEQIEQYAGRIYITSMMLEKAETAAELRFGDDKFPFVYNTARWDDGVPLAGWTTDNAVPRPSHLPVSMIGTWMMALEEPARSARDRLLRAALWQTKQAGLRSALQLAADLSSGGFLLNRDDLQDVFELLLLARDQVNSDDEMVAGLLGGAAPTSPRDFLDATLSPGWVTQTSATSPTVLALVQQLMQITTPRMVAARHSSSLGEWVLNQQRLYNLIGPMIKAVRTVLPKLPLEMRAVMTQLGEINADAGNSARLLKIKVFRIPSYSLVADQALDVAMQYHARLGSGWEDRLCQERVVVPDELRSVVLDITGDWPSSPLDATAIREFVARQVNHQKRSCPPSWTSFSLEYSHPFVDALQPELKDPEFVSSAPLTLEALQTHPLVEQVLNRHHISDPSEKQSLLLEATQSRPGRFLGVQDRLLIEQMRGLASGTISLRTETDVTQQIPEPTYMPSQIIEELIIALAQAANDIGKEMLRDVMSRVMDTMAEGRYIDAIDPLRQFLAIYPWCADARGALAATQSAIGKREAAVEAMIQALILAPTNADSWRLLAEMLAQDPEDSEEAALIYEFSSQVTR
jgi:hypothetical protein